MAVVIGNPFVKTGRGNKIRPLPKSTNDGRVAHLRQPGPKASVADRHAAIGQDICSRATYGRGHEDQDWLWGIEPQLPRKQSTDAFDQNFSRIDFFDIRLNAEVSEKHNAPDGLTYAISGRTQH